MKGADWRDKPLVEATVIAELGGEVAFIDLVPGHSTTAIIKRLRALPLHDGEPSGDA